MVIFMPKVIQPSLAFIAYRKSAPLSCSCQRSMKPFHFSLRLRMPVPAEVQSHTLLDDP